MTDPIADYLTRLRNAINANQTTILNLKEKNVMNAQQKERDNITETT